MTTSYYSYYKPLTFVNLLAIDPSWINAEQYPLYIYPFLSGNKQLPAFSKLYIALAAIKEKYVQKVSTATGEATWTPEQAKQYNEAVEEYNKAVLAAKEAMTKLDEAKTGYADAKNNLTTAKDAFFANMNNNIPQTPIDNGVAPPVENQTDSGTQLAGGLEITEEGATIGMGGTTQLDENGVVEPPATNTTNTEVEANVPAEEIIDEDAVEQTNNNGIPIVDIAEGTIDGNSSTNSGQISNDDIMF